MAMNRQMGIVSRFCCQAAAEGEWPGHVVVGRRHHSRVRLDHIMEAQLQFRMLAEGPNATGTGQSGSKIESTWLVPASPWPASSSRPQTVILNGAILSAYRAPHLIGRCWEADHGTYAAASPIMGPAGTLRLAIRLPRRP